MTFYSVFKYPIDPLKLDDASGMDLMLPRGSRPLYATAQGDAIVLYAAINRHDSFEEWRRLYVVGTGPELRFDHELYDSMGVASLEGGRLMFHVFISKEVGHRE